jgi:hypothetical protein
MSPNDASLGNDFFLSKTVVLGYRQQQVFGISGMTSNHFCSFRIQVSVLYDGKIKYETIGYGRNPFKVTAAAELNRYQAVYEGGVGGSPCPGNNFGQFGMVKPWVDCP